MKFLNKKVNDYIQHIILQKFTNFHAIRSWSFQIICNEIGWPRFFAPPCRLCYCRRVGRKISSSVSPGSGRIWLDNVHCNGSETDIGFCTHRGWGTHSCSHNDDVSISCIASVPRKLAIIRRLNIVFIYKQNSPRSLYITRAHAGK